MKPYARLFWFALLWWPASTALASDHALDDPVPGSNGLTFLQLLQPALGTFSQNGTEYSFTPVPDLDDIDPEGDIVDAPEKFGVSTVQAEATPGHPGKIAVLADSGAFYAVLAVFDPAAERPLLNAAVVAYDRWSGLMPASDLAGGASLIDVKSGHGNSGQTYAIDTLVMFDGKTLSLIDNVFTLSDAGCGFNRTQKPEFALRPAANGKHADIEASVTETVEATGETCEEGIEIPAPSRRRVAVTYHWDDATGSYAADSDALAVLQDETSERF